MTPSIESLLCGSPLPSSKEGETPDSLNRIHREFQSWAAANPKAVELFFRFADEAWEHGRRTIGAKLIVERIRWETSIITSGEDYKINNNYTAYLARMYVKKKPERDTLFKFREVASQNRGVLEESE